MGARRMDDARRVDAAVALAYSLTVPHNELGTGLAREPQAVVDALRTCLDPHAMVRFPRTLIDGLLAADHPEVLSIVGRECDWGVSLSGSRGVLCLSMGEANSTRYFRRMLGAMRREWSVTRSGAMSRGQYRR
jgi:hypothetical protein